MPSLVGPTYDGDSDVTATLGNYLNRPVVIDTYTWSEAAASVWYTFDPWHAYFNNAYIKKKIDNYARLHCTLKLKFVINASPFYYGMLRVCYDPLASRGLDNTGLDQTPFSQMPGVELMPQTMTTATMELPFLWPGNWLNVSNANEFTDVGKINYVQYAALRSANGVVGAGITITCYAWAENVTIAGPTASLALQSDEYQVSGTISGPATAVANIAARLTDVPIIGTMARATQLGASAVAGIARLFGFSNPPVIEDVQPFQPKSFHAFANVETCMPVDKLCLDPKNEVTIDNTVAGTDSTDELALSNFIRRESFLQGTLWAGTAAPGDLLWSASVSPTPAMQSAGISQTREYHTPLSYCGRLFRFWRGSVVYKIKIVKSKYHTGRIAITWDPNPQAAAVTDSQTTCFTRIVDIQVEDEIEIVVPYKATTPWLLADFYTNTYSNGAAPALTNTNLAHNGTLTIRVQNVLTGPAASPEIDLLVYTYGGEDFAYNVPKELPQHSVYPVQSGESVVMDNNDVEIDAHVAAITTGESVASLRPLLHRASFWKTEVLGQTLTAAATYIGVGMQQTTNIIPRMPYGWGYDVDHAYQWADETIGIVAVPFAYVAPTPINFITNCFAGYRGSTTIHANIQASTTNGDIAESATLSRYPATSILSSTTQHRNRFTVTGNPQSASALARLTTTDQLGAKRRAWGQTGLTLTNARTQSALSANVPQYSQWRFYPAFEPVRDRYLGAGVVFQDNVRLSASFSTAVSSASMQWPVADLYYAAGVDFNPVFFVCTPRMYSYLTPDPVEDYTP